MTCAEFQAAATVASNAKRTQDIYTHIHTHKTRSTFNENTFIADIQGKNTANWWLEFFFLSFALSSCVIFETKTTLIIWTGIMAVLCIATRYRCALICKHILYYYLPGFSECSYSKCFIPYSKYKKKNFSNYRLSMQCALIDAPIAHWCGNTRKCKNQCFFFPNPYQ